MSFHTVIEKYRASLFSKRSLGDRFERLMQSFLRTYQPYGGKFKEVWLWSDFPYRAEFGSGQDIGIDLVCKTVENEYWAVQCKCYGDDVGISKDDVDSFLSASRSYLLLARCFMVRMVRSLVFRIGYGFPPRITGVRMLKSHFGIKSLKSIV